MELNISRTKPKRERGHNWSAKEKIILFECVKDYLHIVSDCRNAVEVRKKKNLTWAWVAKLARDMGVFVNETLKFKTQWKRMRIAAKKNIHAYQNGLRIDGRLVIPSELDWNVYNAISNLSNNTVQQKSLDGEESSLPNEIKHENLVNFGFDISSNSQTHDDVYSIEDESVSSQSDVSIGSRTSNIERTSEEDKIFQETESVLQQTDLVIRQTQLHNPIATNNNRAGPSELDWNLYNAITSVCRSKRQNSKDELLCHSLPSQIKNELPDEYATDRLSTPIIQDGINNSVPPLQCATIGTQTSHAECKRPVSNTCVSQQVNVPPNTSQEHHDKMLAVQIKIEEAKLKEIEERIHQQRVIFELNKTLLQKQIENESVKKYV